MNESAAQSSGRVLTGAEIVEPIHDPKQIVYCVNPRCFVTRKRHGQTERVKTIVMKGDFAPGTRFQVKCVNCGTMQLVNFPVAD